MTHTLFLTTPRYDEYRRPLTVNGTASGTLERDPLERLRTDGYSAPSTSKALMSSARHAVMRGPSLTGFG